ncbi:BlaI/MecI/CopY family transcriptional regulator [Anaerocolumna sp. MB42-C2]|uniref:BlaI/MecI/CopY family transcriptional regulator n=1 Tax=Anaerocolumna sp. MB42-C2 TaxID=3070997 RepID=UPI0027E03EBF|nr:BlaI/MecI/CopY family transcriptional regulator [Anaerocolumna sp. MB42-C2]WMJ90092.1 BlaI/MecI/CopY family transcriptional regulator [Anaerocolumna sp. MB42-C2]
MKRNENDNSTPCNNDRQSTNNNAVKTVTLTKLPETEFEVMSAVWKNIPPVTTAILMNQLGNEKGWKLQTLITLLNRLTERGFLHSEKAGKERTYYPCIKKEDYIQYETNLFVERYHANSLFQLVNAFTGNNKLSKSELDELNTWLKNQEEE